MAAVQVRLGLYISGRASVTRSGATNLSSLTQSGPSKATRHRMAAAPCRVEAANEQALLSRSPQHQRKALKTRAQRRLPGLCLSKSSALIRTQIGSSISVYSPERETCLVTQT